ncbi:MAG TPA: UvrD-helicase domain-containing protein, partial [Nevskiaceae bacterium]|nr:UvrD-helicase domain-containing protein [Nevskiaceae bacterium]
MSRRKTETPLPVFAATLAGLRAVEASAGTGKTWTICGLYVRLLLERQASVADILAITFTKSATAELRDRIRARLQEMLLALEDGAPASTDPFVTGMLERIADRTDARLRLVSALCSFDEAPIQTIHGFCQRALADHAFSSRVAFDCTLQPDITHVLHEVAADFWRREVATCRSAGANPRNQQFLAAWLENQKASVEALEDWALKFGRRENVEVRRPAQAEPVATALDAFFTAFEQAREIWSSRRGEIEALL